MSNDENKYKFKVGQRVKLKPDRSGIYPRAWGESQGIVRGLKYDSTGYFPLVYIAWDKEHWTHNGEQNMWTFEEHFEPVESIMDNRHEDFLSELAGLIERHRDVPSVPESPPEESPEQEDSDKADYLNMIKEGAEFAKRCEAFIVVAVAREPNPMESDSTVLIPEIFTGCLNDEAGLLMETQLSQIAAAAHTETAAALILSDRQERH